MKNMVRSMKETNHTAKDAINSNINGRVTSVSGNGKSLNAENASNSEIRELTVMLPFGISSSALDGVAVQIIMNGSSNGTVVGCMDSGRPSVSPGQIVIYDKSGSKIEMMGDGSIKLTPSSGSVTIGGVKVAKSGDKIKVNVSGTDYEGVIE